MVVAGLPRQPCPPSRPRSRGGGSRASSKYSARIPLPRPSSPSVNTEILRETVAAEIAPTLWLDIDPGSRPCDSPQGPAHVPVTPLDLRSPASSAVAVQSGEPQNQNILVDTGDRRCAPCCVDDSERSLCQTPSEVDSVAAKLAQEVAEGQAQAAQQPETDAAGVPDAADEDGRAASSATSVAGDFLRNMLSFSPSPASTEVHTVADPSSRASSTAVDLDAVLPPANPEAEAARSEEVRSPTSATSVAGDFVQNMVSFTPSPASTQTVADSTSRMSSTSNEVPIPRDNSRVSSSARSESSRRQVARSRTSMSSIPEEALAPNDEVGSSSASVAGDLVRGTMRWSPPPTSTEAHTLGESSKVADGSEALIGPRSGSPASAAAKEVRVVHRPRPSVSSDSSVAGNMVLDMVNFANPSSTSTQSVIRSSSSASSAARAAPPASSDSSAAGNLVSDMVNYANPSPTSTQSVIRSSSSAGSAPRAVPPASSDGSVAGNLVLDMVNCANPSPTSTHSVVRSNSSASSAAQAAPSASSDSSVAGNLVSDMVNYANPSPTSTQSVIRSNSSASSAARGGPSASSGSSVAGHFVLNMVSFANQSPTSTSDAQSVLRSDSSSAIGSSAAGRPGGSVVREPAASESSGSSGVGNFVQNVVSFANQSPTSTSDAQSVLRSASSSAISSSSAGRPGGPAAGEPAASESSGSSGVGNFVQNVVSLNFACASPASTSDAHSVLRSESSRSSTSKQVSSVAESVARSSGAASSIAGALVNGLAAMGDVTGVPPSDESSKLRRSRVDDVSDSASIASMEWSSSDVLARYLAADAEAEGAGSGEEQEGAASWSTVDHLASLLVPSLMRSETPEERQTVELQRMASMQSETVEQRLAAGIVDVMMQHGDEEERRGSSAHPEGAARVASKLLADMEMGAEEEQSVKARLARSLSKNVRIHSRQGAEEEAWLHHQDGGEPAEADAAAANLASWLVNAMNAAVDEEEVHFIREASPASAGAGAQSLKPSKSMTSDYSGYIEAVSPGPGSGRTSISPLRDVEASDGSSAASAVGGLMAAEMLRAVHLGKEPFDFSALRVDYGQGQEEGTVAIAAGEAVSVRPALLLSGSKEPFRGEAWGFRVSPPLPRGLELDGDSGALRGTSEGLPDGTTSSHEVVANARIASGHCGTARGHLHLVDQPTFAASFAGDQLPQSTGRRGVVPTSEEDLDEAYVAVAEGNTGKLKNMMESGTLKPEDLESDRQSNPCGHTLLNAARGARHGDVIELFYKTLNETPLQAPQLIDAEGQAEPEELTLTYPTMPRVLPRGRPVEQAPRLQGKAGYLNRSFRVMPPLPSGLVLEERTGVIRGVPRAELPATHFTVVFSAPSFDGRRGATAEHTFSMAVVSPIQNLHYPSVERVIDADGSSGVVGSPSSPRSGLHSRKADVVLASSISLRTQNAPAELRLAPILEGRPDIFKAEPPLPEGLSIDKLSGEIHGCPRLGARKSHSSRHTVSAGNGSGFISCHIKIEVTRGLWGLTLVKVCTLEDDLCTSEATASPTRLPSARSNQSVDWLRTADKCRVVLDRFGSLTAIADASRGAMENRSQMVKGMGVQQLLQCLGLEKEQNAEALLLQAIAQRAEAESSSGAQPHQSRSGTPPARVTFAQGDDGPVVYLQPSNATPRLAPMPLPSTPNAAKPPPFAPPPPPVSAMELDLGRDPPTARSPVLPWVSRPSASLSPRVWNRQNYSRQFGDAAAIQEQFDALVPKWRQKLNEAPHPPKAARQGSGTGRRTFNVALP